MSRQNATLTALFNHYPVHQGKQEWSPSLLLLFTLQNYS
jgi:hypothetical protein